MDLVTTHTFRYPGASGAVLNADEFATVDATGALVAASAATGLATLGTLTASGTGDGATLFTIKLGGLVLADNDGAHAVTAASIGDPCYLTDGHTVSSNATGTSVAGTVLGFVGAKVLVKIA